MTPFSDVVVAPAETTAGAPVHVDATAHTDAVAHSDAVTHSDAVLCADGLTRPAWAVASELLQEYYDTEWGMPITEEHAMFERLVLEGFQAGLSWSTVLTKRPRFREVFAQFDPDQVAAFDEAKVEELMTDAGIIRNRAKILAAIKNARATIELRAEGGLSDFVWSFKPEATPTPDASVQVPTQSPESVALSKALKKRGFGFVGPTTMYALMEAVGVVDTHLMTSHRRGSSGIWEN